jgi:proteasome lid subunit RPN8/RPN11
VLEREQRPEQGSTGSGLRPTAGRGVVTAAAGGEDERRGGATERLATRHGGPHRAQTSLHLVRISRAHWDELIAHAREDAPNECCGYLSSKDGLVEAVFRAENPRKSPYGYELDHKSLFAANELDDEGFEVGIYHSHPRSPAEPSQTDINLATYPHWRYLIISLEAEPVVRVWRIADGRVEEEELDVVDA